MRFFQARRNSNPGTILLREAGKRYGRDTWALRDVDLVVPPADFAFLVGPSGAGKSTLLRLLTREEPPTTGEVWVAGVDLTNIRTGAIPAFRRRIGVVFQDFRLLPTRTAHENVAFALEVTGVRGKALRSAVDRSLDLVGLGDRGDARPSELSGGEQQRVAIARALVRSPQYLLADEPTGNLDPTTSWEIMRLLLDINALGVTVIVASHDADLVDGMRRRVIEIAGGQIVRDEAAGSYHEGVHR